MADFETIEKKEDEEVETEEVEIPEWDLTPPFDTVNRGQM